MDNINVDFHHLDKVYDLGLKFLYLVDGINIHCHFGVHQTSDELTFDQETVDKQSLEVEEVLSEFIDSRYYREIEDLDEDEIIDEPHEFDTTVYLDDIVDAFMATNNYFDIYLNKETAEIIYNDGLVDIEMNDNLIALPMQFEIDDGIMRSFIFSKVDDEKTYEQLLNSIKDRGAYRYFKDGITEHGLLQDYFDYRDEAYKDKAMKWCHRHHIKVIIEKPTD